MSETKSRPELMRENLRIRLNIEQLFIDADSWNRNVRKDDEPKINPDPNGQLAGEWLLLHSAAIEWSEVFKPAMEKHFKEYAKPSLAPAERAQQNSTLLKGCEHTTPSESGFCDDCGKFV